MSASTIISEFELCPMCRKQTAVIYMRAYDEKTRLCLPCFHITPAPKNSAASVLRSEHLTRKALLAALLVFVIVSGLAFALFHWLPRKRAQPAPRSTPPPTEARPAAATPAPTPPPATPIARATPLPSPPPAATPIPTPRSVTLNLRGDVLFDFGRQTLKPGAESSLREVAAVLRSNPEASITIRGYTDGIGRDEDNQILSLQRAESVRDWLVGPGGVVPRNLGVEGRGEGDPVAPNTHPDGTDNPEGRERNRRVTVTVTSRSTVAP